jgi:hypothetical protein
MPETESPNLPGAGHAAEMRGAIRNAADPRPLTLMVKQYAGNLVEQNAQAQQQEALRQAAFQQQQPQGSASTLLEVPTPLVSSTSVLESDHTGPRNTNIGDEYLRRTCWKDLIGPFFSQFHFGVP